MSFREVGEVSQHSHDISKSTKAFDNTVGESGEVRHIKTINEDLAGTTYPGTDVCYRKRVIWLNGERVEGVFPVFDSSFDTQLPRNLWMASDERQFKYCTERLKAQVESDPDLAAKFTARQLQQIKNCEPRISGYTWHHNEISGKMQLVDAGTHAICRHTGGKSLWGGGADYRGLEGK